MSLDEQWAEALDDVALSYLYAICDRLIEGDDKVEPYAHLRTKGEQDTAWAVKHEFERRLAAQDGNDDPLSSEFHGGVWYTAGARRQAATA
jgi:hypothetical protein